MKLNDIGTQQTVYGGFTNSTRKKYIKSQKSAIVYGDVYETRAIVSILPNFKGYS